MDHMRVTILGSGTVVPFLKRAACSFLLELGDLNILFEIGAGTMRRILEAGKEISDISYLFISHLHLDHAGEFASYIFASKYPETYRRRKPLTVVGARGLNRLYEGLKDVYGEWMVMEDGLLNLIELDNSQPDSLETDRFQVRSLPVPHIKSSIGYRLTAPNGLSIAYSGDTDFCEDLITLARDTDLFICEASTPEGRKAPGHLMPSEAGEIASRARVKKLVLTHFFPECDEADMEAQCRKTYQGPLLLANDLMTIDVG
jgi:ribonuclease BN (tRNA processing enzyme)